MSLTAGVRLGPCEILAPIGAGGMGEVYKAQDTRLERTVAIKVLPEHLAESPAPDGPDGKRFLMVRREPRSIPTRINVVFNWLKELERLVPTEN